MQWNLCKYIYFCMVILSSRMNRSPSYAHSELFAWFDEKIWVPSSVPRVMKSLAVCVHLCSHRVSYKSSASENPLTAQWASAVIGWDRKGRRPRLSLCDRQECMKMEVSARLTKWEQTCHQDIQRSTLLKPAKTPPMHFLNYFIWTHIKTLFYIPCSTHMCFYIIQHRNVFSQEHL